jgi:hypothetical protein
MEEEYKEISKRNLAKLLLKIKKRKVKRDVAEVELAIKGLNFWHCVRQENVASVIQQGAIRVKNRIHKAEMTNNSSDYVQGFDRYLSMSIGKPWLEYGPYAFAFGLEHISDDALFYFQDPWLYENTDLEENFLTKEDFIIYQKESLLRNLRLYKGLIFPKIFATKDLHKLIKKNCSTFEVKNPQDLSIQDVDEMLFMSQVDAFLLAIVRLLGSTKMMVAWLFCFIMLRFVA